MSKKTNTFQRTSMENEPTMSKTKVSSSRYSIHTILEHLDTSVIDAKVESWIEKLRNSYTSRMAQAKTQRKSGYLHQKTPLERKLQGQFLEELVSGILKEKGYTVVPHKVENRYEVDIRVVDVTDGTLTSRTKWVMEVSNTNKGTHYERERLKTHLKNLKVNKQKGNEGYWLTSHSKAIKSVQPDLDNLGVKVIEIGDVVLPENLNETFDKLRKAIDKVIPDAAQEKLPRG